MIKKFLSIGNVGRFHNYNATGDIEFRQITLVYAENGSGKTTLASIIRSIQEQNSLYINERHTVGSSNSPSVRVLFDDGTAKFSNGNWDRQGPPTTIFDSHFVNSHVYAGHYIDGTHRRELYRFVIGEEQVQLAQRLDGLDSQLREINKQIVSQSANVSNHSDGMSEADFLKLAPVTDIDRQIEETTKQLDVQKKAQKLKESPLLSELSVPQFDHSELSRLLSFSIEDVAGGAERLVTDHIATHLNVRGETWLRDGTSYVNDDGSCPFCGQSLSGSSLVAAYKTYFSAQYTQLLEEIRKYEAKVQTVFSERALSSTEKSYALNLAGGKFWQEYVNISVPNLRIENVRTSWESLRKEIFAAIRIKQQNPLASTAVDGDFQDALTKYQEILSEVTRYNAEIDAANKRIKEKKEEIAAGSVQNVQNALRNLRRLKTRFKPEVVTLCDKLSELQSSKARLEQDKESTRRQLADSETELLNQYQTKLNEYLRNFGTDFRIERYRTVHSGGTPRSNFQLKINNESIDIGTAETIGKPCFRTLLSDGDKSTLAFAFFMAKLDTESTLSDKVVVIDDPINSLDWYRRSRSRSVLTSLRSKVRQLIILSHDDVFLREIFEHGSVPSQSTRLLYLRKSGDTSHIEEWDMDAICGDVYMQNCHRIQRYIDGDVEVTSLEIIRSLRPVIERNLRIRFPGLFEQKKWLGDFIQAVRDSDQTHPLYGMKPLLDELTDINDYTAPYHHSDGGGGDMPNSTELRSYAQRTLEFLQGLPTSSTT